MPKGIPNKKKLDIQKEPIDSSISGEIESPLQEINTPVLDNKKDSSVSKQVKKSEAPKAAVDLTIKYPSRTLEELRKIDFVHQYQSKFPKIDRPGYQIAWICNTPNADNRKTFYDQGYDYVPGVETVASGYSDHTGEDRYAHHAMQIPIEIYNKRQEALKTLTNKMYGHILKPSKEGTKLDRSQSGMYDPEGRSIKSVGKVLEATE